ncbi:uncharacterized protein LDX57_001525 [Aspergillus melleus]|uniref:uncharacterized protein n=1 Tax=Aspergillus melleus TaxID=138277 RepID=UPI001E8D4462|nr:uncharacterized protein LDX57_001525 [Aspergillus melleus]KAH8423769.1 hypothetical protein LDX57_001525 [Aspergillus melleus]
MSGMPQIDISITTSSTTLYKYHFGKNFTVTVEATLSPLARKPITVLVLDTPLDKYGTSWFEHNLILTNTETSEAHVTLPRYELAPANEAPLETDELNPAIHRDSQDFFLTLYPGKPYSVAHTLSADFVSSIDIGVDISRYRTMLVEAYNLKIDYCYEISLQDAARLIRWYRFGEMKQVLSGYTCVSSLLRQLIRRTQHVERVNDSIMPPIRLTLQNIQGVTVMVKKTEELTRLAHIEDDRYLFRVESDPHFYITSGSIVSFVWDPLQVDSDSDDSHIYLCD